MRRLKLFLILFIAPALLSACATVYNPATGKKEYIMIGTEQEISIGRQVAREVESKFKVSNDPRYNERVKTVGERVAAVSDRQDLKYYFKVIDDKAVNALSTPGGYVYVNTGLIEKADDDELAAVIGHEVGHIAARHSVQAMQASMLASGGSLAAALLISKNKISPDAQKWANATLNVIMLGYSKEDEFEADKLGVRYSYYAGFDPDGMASFLEKLEQENKERPWDKLLVYLRSHPLYSERIMKARAEAAYLKQFGTKAAK